MGAASSSDADTPRGLQGIRQLSRRKVIAKWEHRQLPEQIFGVVRHLERADGAYAFYRGGRWTQTEDFSRWPLDPPLSDAGLQATAEIGDQIRKFQEVCNTEIHVVISSPYSRCVQTAAQICSHLGPDVRLIIDNSVGEVFGPSVMGSNEPVSPVRTLGSSLEYCSSLGVKAHRTVIGTWPTWPEDLKAARWRYATRFLTYLQRSEKARRNFLLVTHADCVGAAFQMMPSHIDSAVSSVEFGGVFLGRRPYKWAPSKGVASCNHSPTSVVPTSESVMPTNDSLEHEDGGPTSWATILSQAESGWNAASKPTTLSKKSMLFGTSITRRVSDGSSSLKSPGILEESPSPTPELPKASDGWKVEFHNICLRQRTSDQGRQSTVLKKQIKALAKHSVFTKERIEELLGGLSHEPFGGVSTEKALPQRHPEPRLTTCSFSTYLFGASDTGSDCCSDRVFTDTSLDVSSLLYDGPRGSNATPIGTLASAEDVSFPALSALSKTEMHIDLQQYLRDGSPPRDSWSPGSGKSPWSPQHHRCHVDRHKRHSRSVGALSVRTPEDSKGESSPKTKTNTRLSSVRQKVLDHLAAGERAQTVLDLSRDLPSKTSKTRSRTLTRFVHANHVQSLKGGCDALPTSTMACRPGSPGDRDRSLSDGPMLLGNVPRQISEMTTSSRGSDATACMEAAPWQLTGSVPEHLVEQETATIESPQTVPSLVTTHMKATPEVKKVMPDRTQAMPIIEIKSVIAGEKAPVALKSVENANSLLLRRRMKAEVQQSLC